MAEFVNNASQSVAVGSNVLFTDNVIEPCYKVKHRKGSGIFTLTGGSTYTLWFNGNISGATADTEVDLAFTINSEEVAGSRMASVPSVANALNSVSSCTVISVPCGCCYTVAVENVGATVVTVANANLVIAREG